MSIRTFAPSGGSGVLAMRAYGSSAALLPVGNVGPLQITHERQPISVPDYTRVGGGEAAHLERITAAILDGTLHDLDAGNLARVLAGGSTAVEAGTTDSAEAHTAYQGGIVPLTYSGAHTITVASAAGTWAAETDYAVGAFLDDDTNLQECTTAGESGESEPAWSTTVGGTTTDGTAVWTNRGAFAAVENTDWERYLGAIRILEGAIPDGCPITVSYSYPAQHVIEPAQNTGAYWEVWFFGLNELLAHAGTTRHKAVRILCYKCSQQIAEQLALIGEQGSALNAQFQLRMLVDDTVSGSSTSKLYQVRADD